MKIAFTGTSSTGKTTTALRLEHSGILSGLGLRLLRPPDTRRGLRKKVSALLDTEKIDFQSQRFNDKIGLEANVDNFLVERSFVDLLAYRYLIAPSPSNAEIAQHINLAKNYSLHFFFPYGVIPYEEDGFRPDEEYSLQISTKIQEIMEFYKIPYISLKNSSLESRCDIISTEIFKFKQSLE